MGALAGALVGALVQALLWENGASKFIYQFFTVSFLESVAREPILDPARLTTKSLKKPIGVKTAEGALEIYCISARAPPADHGPAIRSVRLAPTPDIRSVGN